MSIDLQSESLLSLQQSRTAFPGGKRLSLATLHRWRLKGVRGTRLETILIGGQRYTSTEAIGRFIAAQNASDSPVPTISPDQRRRQAEAAQRALAESGI
jgi:hypothetical protein